ncbi:MAG TPA: hypothetical protein GX505_00320 [Clostridiales bacterium]|nr:hypothetical protein [Clostridiales bacterium]
MCKYAFQCKQCGFGVEIKAEHLNMQDVVIELASECPNLDFIKHTPLVLDAMHELMVTKEKSNFYNLVKEHPHPSGCTVYDNVIDAIGQSLGRYYEIA